MGTDQNSHLSVVRVCAAVWLRFKVEKKKAMASGRVRIKNKRRICVIRYIRIAHLIVTFMRNPIEQKAESIYCRKRRNLLLLAVECE